MSDQLNKMLRRYRIGYAPSGDKKCKDKSNWVLLETNMLALSVMPHNPIAKNELSLSDLSAGEQLDFRGAFDWCHWGCVTPLMFRNFKTYLDAADDLNGFDGLDQGDQDRVRRAWEAGEVSKEDWRVFKAETPSGSGDEDEDEDGKPRKPKRKVPPKKNAKRVRDDEEEEEEEEETPKKKKAKKAPAKAPARKAPRRKRGESNSQEDLGEGTDRPLGDESGEAHDAGESVKKRKHAAPNKTASRKAPAKAKASLKAKNLSTKKTKKAASDSDEAEV